MSGKRYVEIVSTETILDTEKQVRYFGIIDTRLLNVLNDQDSLIKAKNKQLEDVKRILIENDAINCLKQLGWEEE